MDSIGNGSIPIVGTNFNPEPPSICFVKGTLLETPTGPRAVEDLAPGDLLMTNDGVAQPIVWIGKTELSWPGAPDTNKPIHFAAGAFGESCPNVDLSVSPQHHVVLSGPQCESLFGCDEVLAPAKGLTGLPGVRVMQGKRDVEYYHVMLAQHEIISAHGLVTESFYPGPTAVRMLTPVQRTSLFAVVPALKDDPEDGYGPTVRKKITRREAEKLVEAILADRKAKAIAAE